MKSGLLLAVGDFPEGNATASRLNLLSKTLAAGGFRMTVGLIHATMREAQADQPGSHGRHGEVDFKFFNDRVTRPRGLLAAGVDTCRGMYRAKRYVTRQARAGRLDFLILYTPNMLKVGPALRAARRHNVPVFIEACEIRSQATGYLGRPPLRTRIANGLDKRLEDRAHELSRGVIAISTGIADYFADRGVSHEHIFHLPILVDREPYSVRVDAVVPGLKRQRFLFNSGSFTEKDGVRFIVQAFERILETYPDTLLAFSGGVDAPTRSRVTGYARNPATASRIVFTGYLSREQLIWCYQNAAACLSCRSNSRFANFGFPTKLAEYLASGACVVATDVGDVRRYLIDRESAYIATAEDLDSISAAFDDVFRDPGQAAKIGRAGLAVSAEFDYRSYTDTMTRFIADRLEP